ncbi:hypothetical protein N431DRAFT_63512 [Stipitochalara longipes BDJ]|nr:hypothetical protein N431DRAFT_63512 [Stipitochalara longipes BDJ]
MVGMRAVEGVVWLKAIVAATIQRQAVVRVRISEQLGADYIIIICKVMKASPSPGVPHRLVGNTDRPGRYCKWKKHLVHAGRMGLEVTSSRPSTGGQRVEGERRSHMRWPIHKTRSTQLPGLGASGRLVLKRFSLEVPLGATLAGLLPTNGCSRR